MSGCLGFTLTNCTRRESPLWEEMQIVPFRSQEVQDPAGFTQKCRSKRNFRLSHYQEKVLLYSLRMLWNMLRHRKDATVKNCLVFHPDTTETEARWSPPPCRSLAFSWVALSWRTLQSCLHFISLVATFSLLIVLCRVPFQKDTFLPQFSPFVIKMSPSLGKPFLMSIWFLIYLWALLRLFEILGRSETGLLNLHWGQLAGGRIPPLAYSAKSANI